MRVSPDPVTGALHWRENLDTETWGGCHGIVQVDIKVTQGQTEAGQGLAAVYLWKLGRGKEEVCLGTSSWNQALLTLTFRTSSLQKYVTIDFCCFLPPSLWSLWPWPWETNTHIKTTLREAWDVGLIGGVLSEWTEHLEPIECSCLPFLFQGKSDAEARGCFTCVQLAALEKP